MKELARFLKKRSRLHELATFLDRTYIAIIIPRMAILIDTYIQSRKASKGETSRTMSLNELELSNFRGFTESYCKDLARTQEKSKISSLRPFDGFCARLTGFCARFAHELCAILLQNAPLQDELCYDHNQMHQILRFRAGCLMLLFSRPHPQTHPTSLTWSKLQFAARYISTTSKNSFTFSARICTIMHERGKSAREGSKKDNEQLSKNFYISWRTRIIYKLKMWHILHVQCTIKKNMIKTVCL